MAFGCGNGLSDPGVPTSRHFHREEEEDDGQGKRPAGCGFPNKSPQSAIGMGLIHRGPRTVQLDPEVSDPGVIIVYDANDQIDARITVDLLYEKVVSTCKLYDRQRTGAALQSVAWQPYRP